MGASTFSLQKIIMLLFLGLVLASFNRSQPKIDLVEKIYAHIDRPLYFPDESIWFKAYVVNSSNTVSVISEMMYADLISPKGSVVKTLRLPITNGYAYGDFHISKDWVGGIYTLKMYTNWMRNYGEDQFFTKEINVQKIVQPNLLMNLKFEKEGYGRAAEVIANLKVKDLKNNPLSDTEISMLVLIKGKTYLKQKLRTNAKGKLKSKFKLPENLKTTDVLLNILIPYRGSAESISRSVPVVLDNLDVQFFPESGKMIGETKNTLAFKAINEFGKPVDISGELLDEEGTIILNFDSFHDGMGGFSFTPKSDKKYFARITKPYVSKHKIQLPEVHDNGVRFSIDKQKHSVSLSIFSSINDQLRLRVSNSSGDLESHIIKSKESILKIDTRTFPMGITKFSILGETKEILAERLIFINKQKQLNIDVQLEKEIFNTREKVVVKLRTTNANGDPISSNISVAVSDNKLLSFADDKQDHILSYLLLSSELRGKIHKPVFYFDEEESKASKALDYVMLTHGWRDYITENISLFNAAYSPEQVAIQHGAVVDLNGNPVQAHLLLFETNGKKVLDFDTDMAGKFSFKLLGVKRYTLVAYTDDNQAVYIHRKNRSNGFSSKQESKNGVPNSNTPEGFFGVNKPLQETLKKEAHTSLSMTEDAAALDEVVIVGYGIVKKANVTGSITVINTSEIATQENIVSILQGKVAGVQITKTNGNTGAAPRINIRGSASISGNNQPLFVVDGIPMIYSDNLGISTDQIASISVLRDLAATTLYGSSANNGVVLISTKNHGRNNFRKKKLNNRRKNNYTALDFYGSTGNSLNKATKFYVPVYEGENLPSERTDFRPTIYWNPVVQTNSKGEASIEFYNSDAISSFKITVEGVGYNGLLGRQEKKYSTKKMLNIDFKLPNYMTIGDIVTLPITIINESEELMYSSLKLDLPENLELVDIMDTTLVIAAHSSVLKNISIVAIEKGNHLTIRAAVNSNVYQDEIQKKVTVLSRYFPIETSISGTKSQTYAFEVNHAIPNSITAKLTVYTDIVGDVMHGVESMLRQPYGCFEQVASTTYPNVLILKYLRETKKSRPRIERRAKKYIEDGYRRLAAYETKENGFEWYGNTPPHEALSAYGLMQFKEMSSVYDGVDQNMVKRTVDWLLSRRDGEGGFLQNHGKYGFSSAPVAINNAYIVYAITETDTKVDLKKEYRAAYFSALDSLDTYKLALTALSSHNLKMNSNYENLMSYVKLNIRTYGFEKLPVKHTITRSYGNAKNIEVVAFTLLALLRNYENNEALIHEGIAYLLDQRAYGRFGSTQSTAMSLKALIEYAKKQKAKTITTDAKIEIALNGKVVSKNLRMSTTGKIKIDSLQKYIVEGKQKVNIRFSNEKASFPFTLNINWDSNLPDSSENCKVDLRTEIDNGIYKVGDIVRMKVSVSNTRQHGLPMVTTIIGIPSGASVQPWQLKEIVEQKQVAYYEIFNNYLVFYWRELGPKETKTIHLDLKAEIAGSYKAPASTVYLYYGDEDKKWLKGNSLMIND